MLEKKNSIFKLGGPSSHLSEKKKNCKDSVLIKTSTLQDSETVETPRNHECKVTPEHRQISR